MNIGIVGKGRAGSYIGDHLSRNGHTVFYSARNNQSCSLSQLFSDTSVILFCIPETALSGYLNELETRGSFYVNDSFCLDLDDFPSIKPIIGHISGLLSTDILSFFEKYNTAVFSIHPAFSIPNTFRLKHSLLDQKGCWLFEERDIEYLCTNKNKDIRFDADQKNRKYRHRSVRHTEILKKFLNNFKNVIKINNFDKKLYHTACSVIANLTSLNLRLGSELMKISGIDDTNIPDLADSLLLNTTSTDITGPAARNDVHVLELQYQAVQKAINTARTGTAPGLKKKSRSMEMYLPEEILEYYRQGCDLIRKIKAMDNLPNR